MGGGTDITAGALWHKDGAAARTWDRQAFHCHKQWHCRLSWWFLNLPLQIFIICVPVLEILVWVRCELQFAQHSNVMPWQRIILLSVVVVLSELFIQGLLSTCKICRVYVNKECGLGDSSQFAFTSKVRYRYHENLACSSTTDTYTRTQKT